MLEILTVDRSRPPIGSVIPSFSSSAQISQKLFETDATTFGTAEIL
jgi:hypothetical protein